MNDFIHITTNDDGSIDATEYDEDGNVMDFHPRAVVVDPLGLLVRPSKEPDEDEAKR